MEKMKCPNCGKKFAYEEVNNVVEHNDKEMPAALIAELKRQESLLMVISLLKRLKIF